MDILLRNFKNESDMKLAIGYGKQPASLIAPEDSHSVTYSYDPSIFSPHKRRRFRCFYEGLNMVVEPVAKKGL